MGEQGLAPYCAWHCSELANHTGHVASPMCPSPTLSRSGVVILLRGLPASEDVASLLLFWMPLSDVGSGGSMQASNVPGTNGHVSCANHVTWTSQHAMTRREKALIFMAFREVAISARNPAILNMKKPANALTWRAFCLVAGVGFEPTTFRL
jgi:hypothetical protein